jgi:hypothetical protein
VEITVKTKEQVAFLKAVIRVRMDNIKYGLERSDLTDLNYQYEELDKLIRQLFKTLEGEV